MHLKHYFCYYDYMYIENDQTQKTIAVMDIEKVSMSYLAGEAFTFLKRALQAANQHYPERSFAVCIINAPVVFSMIWRMVKGMVHPNTQKKVRILSKREVLEGLKDLIDVSQIPEFYGGEAKCSPPPGETPRADVGLDSCRFYGKETLAINEYVRKLNAQGQVTSDPFDTAKPSAVPPGVQGALNAKDSGKVPGIASNPSTHSSNQDLTAASTRVPASNKVSGGVPPTSDVTRKASSTNGDEAPSTKSSGFAGFFKRRRGTVTGHADMDHYSVCSETTSANR